MKSYPLILGIRISTQHFTGGPATIRTEKALESSGLEKNLQKFIIVYRKHTYIKVKKNILIDYDI